jgi:8-oxo-dGTP pyrophosphatase MutT (NUDIX family)
MRGDTPMADSDENPQPIRRGVVAVVLRDERFLVIRRAAGVVAPGAFCFPGGGVEGDESETQALVREFH